MYECPNCARCVDETRFAAGCDSCPTCGGSMRMEEEASWIDVARVANLAEAGFLSDELMGHGIEARIHQLQEFSALTDCWSSQYLIRVPAGAVDTAATHIRQHMVEEVAERDIEPAGGGGLWLDQPVGSLTWRPVVFVFLAGVSSFVLGQRFSERQGPKFDHRPPRDLLMSAMETIDRPFVSEPAPGEAGHRLQFDRQGRTWILDTDRDGDGRYDSRQAFNASGAAW